MLQQSDYNEQYYNSDSDFGYTQYSDTTYSAETHSALAIRFCTEFSLVGKKVLVLGCAYGFLVKYLQALGVDAYGIDFSEYAISQAPQEVQEYIILGDVRDSADVDWVQGFDVIIDEDMFSCLDDSEAFDVSLWAKSNAALVIHLLTANSQESTYYNFKSIAEWQGLLGSFSQEVWLTRFNTIEE
jgi:2-polyprenyl-3-methyl-5-hydroxy-6-metoxy-1,4-benzoquinol methylase